MTSTHTACALRIVLLGKTGSGKSAAGNTILGKTIFKVSDFMKSANKLCEKQEAVVGGKTISIIDTPGLFNTDMNKQQLKAEIEKCVEMCSPGPHVFLLVLKLGVRFTEEERDAVKWIQKNFGEEALLRTIILFTHADQLKGKPVKDYIKESNYLLEIVQSCGGRYHSFNNVDRNYQDQVTELLKKINSMNKKMNYYTLKMFKSTQKEIARREWIKKVKIVGAVAVLLLGIVFAFLLLQEKPSSQLLETLQQQEKPSSQLPETLQLQEKPSSQLLETLQLQEKPSSQLLETLQLQEKPSSQLLETLQLQEKPSSQLPETLQLQEKPSSQLPETLQLQEKPSSQLTEKMMSQQEKMMSQLLEKMMSQQEKMMSQLLEKMMSQQEKMMSQQEKMMSQQEKMMSQLLEKTSQQEKMMSQLLEKTSQQEKMMSQLLEKMMS